MEQDRPGRIDIVGTTGLIGSLMCWSIGPIFIKSLTNYLDLWTQNALRYTVACLLWLPYLIYVQKRGRLPRRVWKLAILPVVANLVMQTLWAAGFYYLNPAFHNLLAKSAVVWIVISSMVFFPEERRLLRSTGFWMGLAFSAAGVVGVIMSTRDFKVENTGVGFLIVMAATMMWAVYTVAVKKSFRDIDSRIGFAVVSIYTMAGLSILMVLVGKPTDCLKMPASIWPMLVISGILPIALSHTLYYMTIKRIGATIPALTLLSTPFIVFALSRVVFQETLTRGQWLWGLVLIVGAACSIIAQRSLGRVR